MTEEQRWSKLYTFVLDVNYTIECPILNLIFVGFKQEITQDGLT